MSLEALRAHMDGLNTLLKSMEEATTRNTETRTRVSSRMAKNIQYGDLVEWGYGVGQREVAGWGMMDGEVILHAQNAPLWSLDGDERVRVYR